MIVSQSARASMRSCSSWRSERGRSCRLISSVSAVTPSGSSGRSSSAKTRQAMIFVLGNGLSSPRTTAEFPTHRFPFRPGIQVRAEGPWHSRPKALGGRNAAFDALYMTVQLCRVDFEPVGKRVEVPAGGTLLDAAHAAGIELASVCGGHGHCGRCRLTVLSGDIGGPAEADHSFLSGPELDAGQRLACQTHIVGGVRVHV